MLKKKIERTAVTKDQKILKLINIRTIILVLALMVLFFRYKAIFFVLLFVLLNLVVIYLNNLQIPIPIKIAEFGTFMCSYAYSSALGSAVALSAALGSLIMGKGGFYKIAINMLLVALAFIVPYLRFLSVPIAGILFLTVRTATDIFLNFIVFHDAGTLQKNMKRLLDFTFWTFIYFSFSEGIYFIMKN